MRPFRARHGGLLLAALVSLPLFVGVTTTATASAQDPRQIALGISLKDNTDLGSLDAFTASIGGHQPAMASVWSDWIGPTQAFPSAIAQGLKSRGVTPLIFWLPDDPRHLDQPVITYSKILAGQFDAYIRTWAQAAKDFGKTVLLRFAHEMNGDWFPWGVHRFDNTPALFLAAWRHIVDIFRGPGGVGANNVEFMWSPYTPMKSLYPGDKYVDYVGFTAFNWGKGQPWKSMKTVYSYAVESARTFTTKPMIAAETGSTSIGGDKVAWITDGYPAVYRAYPEVVGIVYFDINTLPGQVDWRLTTPAAALPAYAAIAADWRFQGSIVPPTVSVDDVPRISNRSVVPITITARNPNGRPITGYFVSTVARAPTSASPWDSTAPSSVALGSTDGSKSVYAWVRDAGGAISAAARAPVTLDRTAPVASINIGPTATNRRHVAIKVTGDPGTGTAIDGFIVRQGGTAPGPNDAGWTGTPPTGIDLAGSDGTVAVSAWVRDHAGNVSVAATDQVIFDTVAPKLTLSAPTQAQGRQISISLKATDDRSGVTRYYVSQSSTTPTPAATGWTATQPTTWSLTGSAGTKQLYAWVRDAAGNISARANATIGLQMLPSVSLTTSPVAKSRSIYINLSASDPRGNQITGYFISESSTKPTTASNWLSSAPTLAVLSSGDGAKRLYAWAKADDGTISSSASADVLLDTVAPTVSVQLPSSSSTLTVPLTVTAHDAGSGISGIFASESSTPPTPTAVGWSSSPPSSFTFSSGTGQRTLHVWARDAAGNLSSVATGQVTISGLTTYVSDNFKRTVANGFGTAPTGGAYDAGGATLSVNGSQGVIQTSPGVSGRAMLDTSSSPTVRDVQIGLTFSVQGVPSGSSSVWLYLAARSTSVGEYRLKIRIDTAGKMYLGASRLVNGTEVDIASEVAVPGVTAAVGHSYHVWGQVGGSPAILRLRLWDLAGSDPGGWQLVSSSDSTAALQGAGAMGLRTYVSSHITGSQTLRVDDYTVTDVP